jgi:hypothetical protein
MTAVPGPNGEVIYVEFVGPDSGHNVTSHVMGMVGQIVPVNSGNQH